LYEIQQNCVDKGAKPNSIASIAIESGFVSAEALDLSETCSFRSDTLAVRTLYRCNPMMCDLQLCEAKQLRKHEVGLIANKNSCSR